MKLIQIILGALFIVGCATAPESLVEARATYASAEETGAKENAPAELQAAADALAAAEEAFDKLGPDDDATATLAYVATRKAELASVVANTYTFEQKKISKDEELLAENKVARKKLEADLARVRAELEKVASIKEEPNRMVITLNGSVLFETGKFDVRPAAMHRLDQVSQVLAAEGSAKITVMGYTDSQGSDSDNQKLSENRASSVRNYLVQKGVAQDRIASKGLGESNPVASNDTETGRANNRRVEIIVDRTSSATSSR